jgi:hypothetical protein
MGLSTNPPFDRVNTPQWTINELEQRAAQEVAKMRLGVVDPDLLVPFDQMQRHNVWQYKSDGGHPSLLPMGILRGIPGDPDKSNDWQGYYNALFNALPDDVKEKLSYENSLPPEDRDPQFFALDFVIRWSAMASLFLDKGARSEIRESTQNEALLNGEIPEFAFNVVLNTIQEGFDISKETIGQTLGANNPEGEAILQSWQDLYDLAQGLS